MILDLTADVLFHFIIIIPTLYVNYIVSVHRVAMENRPVDPAGSIQGSHRPVYRSRGLNTEHARTAFRKVCETEY